MKSLIVDLGERSYPIFIGENVLTEERLSHYIQSNDVVIITNSTIKPLHLQTCLDELSVFNVHVFVLDDGEQFKTLDSVESIYGFLLKHKVNRNVTLIALGGGVIGDITGFVAATYQRGVSFIQIPTTLLSQVDSSVGGKTGVNHALGKNMIGAFYQPKAVFAQLSFLATLSDRDYFSGMAEVIKYALIDNKILYTYLVEHADKLVMRDSECVSEIIRQSCNSKARIVALDERESGVRALLNLGHTFGHAIETLMEYNGIVHGEAVAIGMLMAADLSCSMNMITSEERREINSLIQHFNLPTSIPVELDPSEFRRSMNLDKKNVTGSLRLILMNGVSNAYIEKNVNETLLMDTLNRFILT
ncbi:MAG: 3-dehydroquinate synthase [Pseudomonadota bacterium]